MKQFFPMVTPQTLKGFRDFLPEEKRKRDFVTQKVIEIFELFGFEPLETPTLEQAALLLGKYGSEADKLIYTFKDKGGRDVGLRYDQTVPTARVLVQYQNSLPKYFRRYQIQNVFRADKPQKGRYREFTQCDIDIFGTTNPLSDAEIITCTFFAYKNVGYPKVILKINDRQTLFYNLSKFSKDNITIFSIIQTVDKLDKIPESSVIDELISKGLTKKNANQALQQIKSAQPSSNLKKIIDLTISLGVPKESLIFTPTLARGLDYYTGMIFEVIVPEYGNSSLGGGGRYDKLIGQLGGLDIPAVGIAFGFDRMVETAELLNLIPTSKKNTRVLVTIFDESLLPISLNVTNKLRANNIPAEIYINPADKLDKQLKYADKKGIPFVVILGPEEIKNKTITLKNLRTKEQETITEDKLINRLR